MWCRDCEHCRARVQHEQGVYHEHLCQLTGAQVFPAETAALVPSALMANRRDSERDERTESALRWRARLEDSPARVCPKTLFSSTQRMGSASEIGGIVRVCRSRGMASRLLAHYTDEQRALLLRCEAQAAREAAEPRPARRGERAKPVRVVMGTAY